MTNREAIETLKENVCLICAYGGKNIDECDIRYCDNREAFNIAIKALENQKTGRWIRKNDICTSRVQLYQFECSNCREINTFRGKYCPNCGVKMEGK